MERTAGASYEDLVVSEKSRGRATPRSEKQGVQDSAKLLGNRRRFFHSFVDLKISRRAWHIDGRTQQRWEQQALVAFSRGLAGVPGRARGAWSGSCSGPLASPLYAMGMQRPYAHSQARDKPASWWRLAWL